MNIPPLQPPSPMPKLKPMAVLLAGLSPMAPVAKPPAQTPQQQVLVSDLLSTQAPPAPMAQTSMSFVQPPLIGPDDRVLHIGDSHTVGIYGREMDKLLRSTGARVETYGSAGSSPNWWLSGHATKSGFFGKDENGSVDAPANWREPHPTPKLPDLLGRFRPNIVMISLGANMIGADGKYIESEVRKLADIAKASGAKIIWVGPPDGRESSKPGAKQDKLYAHLIKAASQYGAFIDSRPLTEYPASGGDGVHYWGKEGSKIATQWAKDVYGQIQALPE